LTGLRFYAAFDAFDGIEFPPRFQSVGGFEYNLPVLFGQDRFSLAEGVTELLF
jgi:hypothetical protein